MFSEGVDHIFVSSLEDLSSPQEDSSINIIYSGCPDYEVPVYVFNGSMWRIQDENFSGFPHGVSNFYGFLDDAANLNSENGALGPANSYWTETNQTCPPAFGGLTASGNHFDKGDFLIATAVLAALFTLAVILKVIVKKFKKKLAHPLLGI